MTADRSGRLSPALLTAAVALVALLLTMLAGFLVWRSLHFEDGPSRLGGERATFIADSERSDALRVAEQYALRMDAIDGADPEGYAKLVKGLLTTKGKTKFDKEWAALQQLGMDKQTKGKGEILASALSDIDPDSATTLVAHDAVITNGQGTTGRHYRWTIELEKVKGRWLVDEFSQVD